MTGATSFTRKAGLAGVVSSVLAVLMVPMLSYLERRRWERAVFHDGRGGGGDALVYLVFGALILCGAVMLAGLAVRHRHHYLTQLAWKIGAAGILAALLFQSVEVAGAGIAAAVLLVMVAVAAVDELPRVAVVLMLAVAPLNDIEGRALELLVVLAGFVGWTWLAFAMWLERDAVPGERLWEGNVVGAVS